MNARETALAALTACRREGAWINEAVKQCLGREKLSGRDAALAARLAYGVTQNRAKLDFYLDQLLTGRRGRLHPAALDILRLGLYQIYALDRIPPSAAVNESVALAKKYCPQAAGLVNGVLRNAVRTRGTLTEPVSYAQRYSHPEELIDLLKQNLPKGCLEPMLVADNGFPQTVVQVNTLRTTPQALIRRLEEEGVDAQAHPWLEGCLTLSGTGDLERLPSFQAGLYYVQDPAARLAVLCAGLPKTGARVLDCCAAPGGKSFAAAIAMEGRGEILSCDVYDHKRSLIEKGAARLGLSQITAQVRDARVTEPDWVEKMDAVIVDAPCSGLGIIRKKPDIRYKDLTALNRLPPLQLEILSSQARHVKPGGVLLYATCTVLRQENEDVVQAFLAGNRDFSPEALPLPDVFPVNTTGMLTLFPGQYDTDGFFICKMRKER